MRQVPKPGRGWLALGCALAFVVPGAPALAQSAVATGVGTPFELAFWQSIDSSNDPSLYESYLNRYPNGTFSEIARAKIITLRARLGPSAAPASPTAPPPPQPYVPPMQAVAATPPPAVAPPAAPVRVAPPVAAPVPAVVTERPPAPPVTQAVAVAPPPPVAPPAAAPTPSSTPPATPAAASTLGQLLAALANSQTAGNNTPAATAQPQPAGLAATAATPSATPPPAPARSTLAAGFALPAAPQLLPVPAVTLPPSFCSAEARNAFHDTVYAPAVAAAKQNNDNAASYMRQLQAIYDQYQLSHDPDTMNAVVAAARGYQPTAQMTFAEQSAVVRQFTALMAVPVVPCAQPGQPGATTLAK